MTSETISAPQILVVLLGRNEGAKINVELNETVDFEIVDETENDDEPTEKETKRRKTEENEKESSKFEINENGKDTLSKDDERNETEIEEVNPNVALKIEIESNSSQKGNERTKKVPYRLYAIIVCTKNVFLVWCSPKD